MKLYYTPGACSMSVHIALREAGLKFETERVDLKTRRTAGGDDFTAINPKGYVPALKLDDGQVLTEAGVCVQYVADQAPASGLAPQAGTIERYRLMEWINYIAAEVHKQFGPLFNPTASADVRKYQVEQVEKRLEFLSRHFSKSEYLMGRFTVADAYMFNVLSWTAFVKIDLSRWPAVQQYLARVGARPAVVETLKAEGLSK